MIYLLTALLLILLVTMIVYYKKDILEPSIIFTFSFLLLSIMATLNAKRFELGLHNNTFYVVLGGVLTFVITSLLVKIIYNKVKKVGPIKDDKLYKIIKPNKYILIAFLVFSVVFCFVYVYYIMKAVDVKFTGISSAMTAISKYDSISKFTEDFSVKLPFLVFNIRVLFIGVGYWLLYVIISNFILFKKKNILEMICVTPCIILSLLEGSRTPTLYMIITAIIVYLIIASKKKGYGKILSPKLIIIILAIGALFICLFKPTAKLLGRKIDDNFSEYISIYCGAQLKNLDIYLNNNHVNNNIVPGAQTFSSIIASYGNKIGFKGYKEYRLDLPFQSVGEVSLGNVYTTFYPYIYDFGYIGLVILVMIMAIISQVIYEAIKRISLGKYPKSIIILYGYIGTSLLLSFFSNKFYENVFSLSILKNVVVWLLCDLIFIKIFDWKREKANEKK